MQFFTLILLAAAVVFSTVAADTTPSPWTLLLQKLINGHVPTATSAKAISDKYTWVPMNVTGPVAPGGPPVTLYGDAKSINAQALKMNPTYNVGDFAEHAVTPPGQPKTAIVPPLCNIWPESGSINLLEEGIVDLNSSSFNVTVPAGSCAALSCIDSASIGICNDNSIPITKITNHLVVYLEILINYCLSSTGTVNGQVFDTGDFNLVFDSGHCNPATVQGSNYQGANSPGAPVGNNGPTTGGNSSSAADPGAPVSNNGPVSGGNSKSVVTGAMGGSVKDWIS